MGYDLHITRATDWAENDGREIPSQEWLELVREDPELSPDPGNGPFAASWATAAASEAGWFDWYEGNVYTTNPTKAAVAKMLALAISLAGRVQGDDGETYEREGDWRDRDL
ncbi:MAG: hypothetical protein AAF628_16645 [Planctomycetota bacterium]